MPWYDVKTNKITEASAELLSVGRSLDMIRQQLDNITIQQAPTLAVFHRKKQTSSNNLRDASQTAKNFGKTLSEIADIYYSAERAAFIDEEKPASNQTSEQSPARQPAAAQPTTPPIAVPTIRQSNAVLFSGSLIVPDWLQSAVLRFEQARRSAVS